MPTTYLSTSNPATSDMRKSISFRNYLFGPLWNTWLSQDLRPNRSHRLNYFYPIDDANMWVCGRWRAQSTYGVG